MTSEERKVRRYYRRRLKREQKKREKFPNADNFEKVFRLKNLRTAYKQCRSGVIWKGNVQRYILRAPIVLSQTHKKIINGKYKCQPLDMFDTHERGILRHISALKFVDRVPQRCYNNEALVPLVTRSFIYDNGACLRNKGYHWQIGRLDAHLHQFYRKHGTDGWVWLFDFFKVF